MGRLSVCGVGSDINNAAGKRRPVTTLRRPARGGGASAVRWSHFFGQVAKVYSGVERRHWNDEEEAPFHGGFQGASALEALRDRLDAE